ncbi:hypothetical protein M8C21_011520 [Ambrosia artemisiifolia]|uniref:Transmembrane protein n=1 Tax=Ambrosia artemisiifolia TaxID=4212 RepID=A0AAD5G7I1_AMBAR|nr:hypothetical protein M8C21_011520 [Ambrosia artemisiifolia]
MSAIEVKMRSKMIVYLFLIVLCNHVILSSADSNNPSLQQELHGVPALTGLYSNKNDPEGSKYILKQGQKGRRGGAHGGGGSANMDRSRHGPRNTVQSKHAKSFSVIYVSFFLLLFAF